jgi:hypothetical protein
MGCVRFFCKLWSHVKSLTWTERQNGKTDSLKLVGLPPMNQFGKSWTGRGLQLRSSLARKPPKLTFRQILPISITCGINIKSISFPWPIRPGTVWLCSRATGNSDFVLRKIVVMLRVGNCYLEVLPGRTGVVAWVLPGVLVLPGVTWRYLECYLVLPGRYLGFYFGVVFFFCGPKISAFLKLKLLEKSISNWRCYLGPRL